MTKNFQNKDFLKFLYRDNNLISFRGNFLKKYSNRKYSLRTFVVKILPALKNKNILDVGCGDCSFLKKLNAIYPQNNYFGLDIINNQKCINQKFIDYEVYGGIEFPKYYKKFDVIFCMHALYHISDFDNFFYQIKSNLKKNGIFIITTKSKFTLSEIESLFKNIANQINFKASDQRDESSFCLENAPAILKKYFPERQFIISEYVLENQLIIDNKKDLLRYILSTARYNIDKETNKKTARRYIELWQEKISKSKIFIDKYIEVVYLIKHI